MSRTSSALRRPEGRMSSMLAAVPIRSDLLVCCSGGERSRVLARGVLDGGVHRRGAGGGRGHLDDGPQHRAHDRTGRPAESSAVGSPMLKTVELPVLRLSASAKGTVDGCWGSRVPQR
eukprot:4665822-Pleurochrysis_carterae.AAC.3